MTEESNFIRHIECEKCGSSDANGVYDDGHTYCFSCGHHSNGGSNEEKEPNRQGSTSSVTKATDCKIQGEVRAIASRNITEETARKFGYRVGLYNNKPAHFAYWYDDNRKPYLMKVRGQDKSFSLHGEKDRLGLYGKWIWQKTGRKIVVTEGELDALSVSQAFGNKYPVVSLPNGAQSAKKVFQKELEYLSGFEQVILMFDMDEAGQKAAKECAAILKPNTAYIATLPLKDASEMLVAKRHAEIVDSVYRAKVFRPDGILSAADLWSAFTDVTKTERIPYPYEGLNKMLQGVGKRELLTVTAGTGVGKSAFVCELAYDLLMKQGRSVGMLMLEEAPVRTMKRLLTIHRNQNIITDTDIDPETLKGDFDAITEGNRLHVYDSFGSVEPDVLMDRLRYMAVGLGVEVIVFDHISIAIAGLDVDDRKALDIMVTKLRSLVEETGVALIMVSHLKRVEGNRGHEDGIQTSLSHLRGSQAIAQTSDIVIGLERNQQDAKRADLTTVRVLKNRFSGQTGVAGTLHYNKDTGRLLEATGFEEVLVDDGSDSYF